MGEWEDGVCFAEDFRYVFAGFWLFLVWGLEGVCLWKGVDRYGMGARRWKLGAVFYFCAFIV